MIIIISISPPILYYIIYRLFHSTRSLPLFLELLLASDKVLVLSFVNIIVLFLSFHAPVPPPRMIFWKTCLSVLDTRSRPSSFSSEFSSHLFSLFSQSVMRLMTHTLASATVCAHNPQKCLTNYFNLNNIHGSSLQVLYSNDHVIFIHMQMWQCMTEMWID